MKYSPSTRHSGFSMVEIIIVIAVMGIVAAIAIPNIGSVHDSADTAKDQRNAQDLVTIYNSGATVGVLWAGATRNDKIADVIAGRSPATGTFVGEVFALPAITGTDLTGMYKYIGVNSEGNLTYDPTGGQTPN